MFYKLKDKKIIACILITFFITSFSCGDCGLESCESFKVLVFSKTAGFRHASIPGIIKVIQKLGDRNNFNVKITENSKAFTEENLSQFDVVVFNNTTQDILNDAQQTAFEHFIQGGRGYVGIHAASDTEYDWEWYGGLIGGAWFKSHPERQEAVINIEDDEHPSTKMLPEKWKLFDEWYNYQSSPREKVKVLASLDETSYKGGDMDDHPIIWCHEYDGGRAWYTGVGHTDETVSNPYFAEHLLEGIKWAAGVCNDD